MHKAFNQGKLIGYVGVTTRGDADRLARELHAVMVGISYYPIRLYSNNTVREVSNVYYFYANGTEVGYWCPQFEQFHIMNSRKWDQRFKDELDLSPLGDEYENQKSTNIEVDVHLEPSDRYN